MLPIGKAGRILAMFEKERDEAIKELEEFQKSIDQIKAKSKSDTAALDRAKAQAARIAERLRELGGGRRPDRS
jgi:uncharacterized coiled-coil DUF342 family protein